MSDSPRPGREPADGDVKDALVSYSRSDLSYVDTLTQHLVDAGFSLWIDRRDILPSAEWMAEVEEGIRRSDCLLFVVSPASVTSPICRAELQHAVDANKRILPVLHDPVAPATETPAPLPDLHGVDGDDIDGIVRGLRSVPDSARMHTRLYTRAWAWQQHGRRRGRPLRGAELTEAAEWLTASRADPEPTDLHRQFVAASRTAARRRRIVAVIAVTVLTVAATITAMVGTNAAHPPHA